MEKILSFRRGPSYWISDQQMMMLSISDADWFSNTEITQSRKKEFIG